MFILLITDWVVRKFIIKNAIVTDVFLKFSQTGRIKGYAFIEFEHPEVAKIAAETMDNYLMYDRLLKG